MSLVSLYPTSDEEIVLARRAFVGDLGLPAEQANHDEETDEDDEDDDDDDERGQHFKTLKLFYKCIQQHLYPQATRKHNPAPHV